MGELNERLKQIRTELHLSQEYVAAYLDVTRTAIAQIENSKRNVSATELAKFSQLYNVSSEELLFGNEIEISSNMFARSFSELDEADQREIINLMKFKKMMKEQGQVKID